jgi:hypothetical protein
MQLFLFSSAGSFVSDPGAYYSQVDWAGSTLECIVPDASLT